VLSIPADYKHDGFSDRLLLFAAETTGALVVPTPTRAIFFCLYLVSVSVIMKTLLLLRHAKAENAAGGSSDINRALDERGKEEAQAIGTFIRKQNLSVDVVLCSPAVRARETAELVLGAAEVTANVRYDQRIYEASPRQLLEVISEVEKDKSAVFLVGHNPGMEDLLSALTGEGEPMATGTLAKINLKLDEWTRVTEDIGDLECIVRPDELAAD
jgi:phosphohistidine phosphatase